MVVFRVVVTRCGGGGRGGGNGCVGIHRQGCCRVVSIFHLRCFARTGGAWLGSMGLFSGVDAGLS